MAARQLGGPGKGMTIGAFAGGLAVGFMLGILGFATLVISSWSANLQDINCRLYWIEDAVTPRGDWVPRPEDCFIEERQE